MVAKVDSIGLISTMNLSSGYYRTRKFKKLGFTSINGTPGAVSHLAGGKLRLFS
jgi:hypothetical protein